MIFPTRGWKAYVGVVILLMCAIYEYTHGNIDMSLALFGQAFGIMGIRHAISYSYTKKRK